LVVAGLLGDNQIREGFVSGFLLILFSELGDKTFFIAVLLAVKYRQTQGLVFAGAFGALAAMTVISVRLLPACIRHRISAACCTLFAPEHTFSHTA
jgi:putative Ca2+/H+ antiporter (TMEM165/GDT1 family)